LHTAKVWKGYVDENNIIAVRDRLIEKINNVMEELAYFRNSKSQELIEIIKFIGDKEILIKQYKNEIQNIDRDYKQYEESIIVCFENFMRPIINEMSNMLETYCVKMNKFTEIIAELQKVFNFDYNIENKIGSLLIRPDDLRLCLENLLENAQKSTQHLTEPNIKLRVSSNGRFIIIAVEDNGGSFSEMDIKKLMRKGEGFKDICNIIEGWEGNLSIKRHSYEDKKPPVTLKIKRL
jgi:signal transduction histidine kinase